MFSQDDEGKKKRKQASSRVDPSLLDLLQQPPAMAQDATRVALPPRTPNYMLYDQNRMRIEEEKKRREREEHFKRQFPPPPTQQAAMPQDATRAPLPLEDPTVPIPQYLSPGAGRFGNVAPGAGVVHRGLQFASEVGPRMAADIAPGIGDILAAGRAVGDVSMGDVGWGTALDVASLVPLVPAIRGAFPRSSVRMADSPMHGRMASHPDVGWLGATDWVPDEVIHVTSNAPGVRASGAIRAGVESGGLGGRSMPNSISTTSSRDAAANIMRELERMGDLARGGADNFPVWLSRIVAEDAARIGVPAEALARPVRQALKAARVGGEAGRPANDLAEAFNIYLTGRGELALHLFDEGSDQLRMWEDPLIILDRNVPVAQSHGHITRESLEAIQIDLTKLDPDVVAARQTNLLADEVRIFTPEIPVRYEEGVSEIQRTIEQMIRGE